MNKKFLMFTPSLLVLSLIMTTTATKPIDPKKPNNPHVMATLECVEILQPSGGVHSWMANTELMPIDFMSVLTRQRPRPLQ